MPQARATAMASIAFRKLCTPGTRIVRREDPRGYNYYWFGLGPMLHTPGHATDLEAIADGYVAVTPLHLDLTHEASLATLGTLYP